MKLRFILQITIILIVISSCNKDNITYQFNGTVRDGTTKIPLEGVSVSVLQKVVSANFLNEKYSVGGSGQTNFFGQYNMIFPREKVTYFNIVLDLEGYFLSQNTISSADVNTNEENQFNFDIDPISTVRFEIKNSTPNTGDELKLIPRNFREGCENCAENTSLYFYEGVDTLLQYETTGNKYVNFIYVDVIGGFSREDSIFAPAFDTILYTIHY
jgi:hypothetical protein